MQSRTEVAAAAVFPSARRSASGARAAVAGVSWHAQINLKLRHLSVLVALAEGRHLGHVASANGVTPSAISKTLAEIEAGLGVRLFVRTGRGLEPTEACRVLVGYARNVLRELDEAGRALRACGIPVGR